MLSSSTVRAMYTIGVEADLVSDRALTADDVTDLIEVLVEELDNLAIEPSVGTTGTGQTVRVRIELGIDAPDEMDALTRGFTAIQTAMRAASVKISTEIAPSQLVPSIHRAPEAA